MPCDSLCKDLCAVGKFKVPFGRGKTPSDTLQSTSNTFYLVLLGFEYKIILILNLEILFALKGAKLLG